MDGRERGKGNRGEREGRQNREREEEEGEEGVIIVAAPGTQSCRRLRVLDTEKLMDNCITGIQAKL